MLRFRVNGLNSKMGEKEVADKLQAFKLDQKFQQTSLAKRIKKQRRRRNLTDFERFRVMQLKKKLGLEIRRFINKNKKEIAESV